MARLAIRMPKMSMTMTEGDVSEWMVSIGDPITEGDVVCEVMTDKVDMEVESSVSGILVEIAVESGMAAVGDPIGWVEGEDTGGGFGDLLSEPAPVPDATAATTATTTADVPASEVPATVLPTESSPPPEPARPAPAAEPTGSPTHRGPVPAVPRARGLATEHGVDLATVVGTGPAGLVRVPDVEAFLTPPAATPSSSAPVSPSAPGRAGKPAPDRKAAIRTAVARTMGPTALVPQFTVWREVELDAADAQRRGVSWTTVLLRAYAAALRQVPDLLCRWQGERAVESGPPSIALAVATDRGLLVPTFADPDLGAITDVDEEVRAVVRAAHTGKLSKAYLGMANGSLSNLGGLGVDRFQALLTPPQASVLSLGSIRRRPVAVPGGVGLALTVEAGITVDHRVADGAHGAQLLELFARRLGVGL